MNHASTDQLLKEHNAWLLQATIAPILKHEQQPTVVVIEEARSQELIDYAKNGDWFHLWRPARKPSTNTEPNLTHEEEPTKDTDQSTS